jgi:hypothetical protein
MISKEIQSIYFDGTIENIIGELVALKDEHGKDFDNLRVSQEAVYDGGYYHTLLGDRLETKEESIERIKLEKEFAQRQSEYRKKQYEALKAEFGD